MNQYWISKTTGDKARIIASPPEDGENRVWLESKDRRRQFWAYKDAFKDYWLPITKAEYDSNITLKEIQTARNNNSIIGVYAKCISYINDCEDIRPDDKFKIVDLDSTVVYIINVITKHSYKITFDDF